MGPQSDTKKAIQKGKKPINYADGVSFVHDLDYALIDENKDKN